MSRTASLPNHLRPKREKLFGQGRPVPLDRNAKVRVFTRARALCRRTEAGKHYGAITAKGLDVLRVLLWDFHNSKSGLCYPSYEAIAAKAGCSRSTVAEAIKMLEDAGLLVWVNRIARLWAPVKDLFGQWVKGWKVIRTSNAYSFPDPTAGRGGQAVGLLGQSSKSEIRSGTPIQELPILSTAPLSPELDAVLVRLGRSIAERAEKDATR